MSVAPLSAAAVVEQALPATSSAEALGVHDIAPATVIVSFPAQPALAKLTVTFVDVPFQAARIDAGSMASVNVKVTVSPASGLPAVPPEGG